MCQNPHGSTVQRGKVQFYHVATRCCAFAADKFLGPPPLILHCFFILFFASFWEGFSNHSGHSLGHHFQQYSEKRRLQCSMKRAYENSPGKNWGLGALQTSKTSSACRREHDSVVWLHARKSLILDAFWTSILEPLGPSCAENIVF